MTDTANARSPRSSLKSAPVRAEAPPRDARSFAIDAARLLADEKCTDVVCLDVRGLSQVSDFLVIGTGTSERQMRAVLSHVEDLGGQTGFAPFRSHSDERSAWLLADCVDVVVHLFDPDARSYYDLEMLWGDGPRVDWARSEGSTAPGRRRPATSSENGEG